MDISDINGENATGISALKFITELVSLMKLDCKVNIEETDDKIRVILSGEDSNIVIGYRGDVLDAIQYLTLLVSNKGDDFKKVVVDTENYRAKRSETLKSLALKLAEKADRTGRRVELEPMNPFERRIIHSTLSDSDKATTESLGEEPNRYVVIIPKNNIRRNDKRFGGNGGNGNGRGNYKNRDRDTGRSNFKPAKTAAAYQAAPQIPEGEYDPYASYEGSANSFKQEGPKKMRSFGYKKPRF